MDIQEYFLLLQRWEFLGIYITVFLWYLSIMLGAAAAAVAVVAVTSSSDGSRVLEGAVPPPALYSGMHFNIKKFEPSVVFNSQGNQMVGFLVGVAKVPSLIVFLGDMFGGANVLAMGVNACILVVFLETTTFLIASILMLIGSTAFCLQEWYMNEAEEWYVDVFARRPTYLHHHKNILKIFSRALYVVFAVLRLGCCIMLLIRRSTIVSLISILLAILECFLGILGRHCLSPVICVPCPKCSHRRVVPAIRRFDGIYVSGCRDCLSKTAGLMAYHKIHLLLLGPSKSTYLYRHYQ